MANMNGFEKTLRGDGKMKILVEEMILKGNLGDFEKRADEVARFYAAEYKKRLEAWYPNANILVHVFVNPGSGSGRGLRTYVDGSEDDYALMEKIEEDLSLAEGAIWDEWCNNN